MFVGRLQRLGRPDQDAVLGALTRSYHDGHGSGQAQGAGAGDDQHGHGIDQGEYESGRWPNVKPDDERPDGDEHDGGNEVAGHKVGESLHRSF